MDYREMAKTPGAMSSILGAPIPMAEPLSDDDFFGVNTLLSTNDIVQTTGAIAERIKSCVEKYAILDQERPVMGWNSDAKAKHFVNVVMQAARDIYGGLPPIDLIDSIQKYFNAIKTAIVTKEIPTIMAEAGADKMTVDGHAVSLIMEVNVKVNDERELNSWLEENGYQDRIKTIMEFEKGASIDVIRETADNQGMTYKVDQKVHAQTLKKIMRDRMEAAEPLPPAEIATINPFVYAKVR